MNIDTKDLLQGFREDCREPLEAIEASLMAMEAAGERRNPELVGSVFRLAHSIKCGAGLLGLDAIKALALRLENVLHLVRSLELVPTHDVVAALLRGFDRLAALVENIAESEAMPIEAEVERLLGICQSAGACNCLDFSPQQVAVDGQPVFLADALSLAQSSSGGNELYLLTFDLLHDIHGPGCKPFELLKSLCDTGRVVDCRVDFAAVGDLESFEGGIPFQVLFATILEHKYVCGLVKLPDERVRRIDCAPAVACGETAGGERFGPLVLQVEGGQGTLTLPDDMSVSVLESLRAALLAGLERCSAVALDLGPVSRCDTFFFQLLLAAERSYAARSKVLRASAPLAEDLRRGCAAQGFCRTSQPDGLLRLCQEKA